MPLMFHDVRLPDEIEQGAIGGPTFYTNVTTQSSGSEQRIALWDRQRLMWQIGYGITSKEDYQELLEFYYARQGRAYGFRFRDYSDYTATDAQFGVGDGSKRVFRISKPYTSGGVTYTRIITHPDTATVVVSINGATADPTTYDLEAAGIVRFHTGHAPAAAAALTWTGSFDVPVRFDIDQMNLTLYALASGDIENNALPIIELREQINNPPTAVEATTVYHATINENTDTSSHIAILDFDIIDDDLGVNAVGLTGTNPLLFEVTLAPDTRSGTLYLKAGTVLDFETLSSLQVTIGTWDTTVGDRPSATLDVTLGVNDVAEPPVVTLTNVVQALTAGTSTASRVLLADIAIAVDFGQTTTTTLTGTDASHFEIFGGNFYLRSGEDTASVHHYLDVQIVVTPSIAAATVKPMQLTIGVVPGEITYDTPGTYTFTVSEYANFEIDVWAAGNATWGYTPGSASAPTAPGRTYVQNDQTVTTFHRWRVEPLLQPDNPDAWTPGFVAATATMASLGVGAALTATVAGNIGGAGVPLGTQDPSFDQPSGAGGYTLDISGNVVLGGQGVRAATPVTDAATTANGASGVAPGTGASGGVYKKFTLFITQIMPGSGTFPPPSIQFTALAGSASGHFAKQNWVYASAQVGSGAGYTAPAPAVGDILTIVIGAGGGKGLGAANGADGQHGRVRLKWS